MSKTKRTYNAHSGKRLAACKPSLLGGSSAPKSVAENNASIVCTRCGGHCHGQFSCDANLAAKAVR